MATDRDPAARLRRLGRFGVDVAVPVLQRLHPSNLIDLGDDGAPGLKLHQPARLAVGGHEPLEIAVGGAEPIEQ